MSAIAKVRVNPPIVRARLTQDRRTTPKQATLENYESYITCEKFDTNTHMEGDMQVWLYPEKRRETFGATRWVASWYVLRAGVDPESEWDPTFDTREICRGFATKEAATQEARRAVDAGDTFFGTAEVRQQRVDWYVEEDRVAEWTDVGREEIVE
jgi:hypothetical protein